MLRAGKITSISVAVDDAFAISEDTPSAGNLADNDALSGDVTFALVDQGWAQQWRGDAERRRDLCVYAKYELRRGATVFSM